MSNSRSRRRQRLRLLETDPHCWYCGRKVVSWEAPDPDVVPRGHHLYRTPPDAATIEHLFQRSPWASRPQQGIRVLACYECNWERNRYHELLLGRDELHLRAHYQWLQ